MPLFPTSPLPPSKLSARIVPQDRFCMSPGPRRKKSFRSAAASGRLSTGHSPTLLNGVCSSSLVSRSTIMLHAFILHACVCREDCILQYTPHRYHHYRHHHRSVIAFLLFAPVTRFMSIPPWIFLRRATIRNHHLDADRTLLAIGRRPPATIADATPPRSHQAATKQPPIPAGSHTYRTSQAHGHPPAMPKQRDLFMLADSRPGWTF